MLDIGMILFFVFLLVLIVADVVMIVSLVWSGDERRQMIVWKTSTYTLIGTMGYMVIKIIESVVKAEEMAVNPFTQLGSAAVIYCVLLLVFRRKYGG